jgi:hypothetical protein
MREIGRGQHGSYIVEMTPQEVSLLEKTQHAINGGTLWSYPPAFSNSERLNFDISHALGAVEAWTRLKFCLNDLKLEVAKLQEAIKANTKVDTTGM